MKMTARVARRTSLNTLTICLVAVSLIVAKSMVSMRRTLLVLKPRPDMKLPSSKQSFRARYPSRNRENMPSKIEMDVQQIPSNSSTFVHHETFSYPNYNIDTEQYPLPIKILQRYIESHGVEALKNNPENRQYAIVDYQCPFEAGNSFHLFANGLLYAILTNRTILWRYWDRETCKKAPNRPKCLFTNTVDDCNQVLLRAPWMAGYHDWKHLLHEEHYYVPFHAAVTERPVEEDKLPRPDNYMEYYGIDLVSKYPQQVVIWPKLYFRYSELGESSTVRNRLFHTPVARKMTKDLFSWGADFLYGMLHRYAFEISGTIKATVPKVDPLSKYHTVALHSRHRFEGFDGCDIEREISCLEDIQKSSPSDKQFRVSLMSDRVCTIAELSSWLGKRGISVVLASHPEEGQDYRGEHGPFAGAGYFYDLAMVLETAQDAFVSMRRSSSDFVRELVEFHRTMRLVEQGKELEKLSICFMPYVADPSKTKLQI